MKRKLGQHFLKNKSVAKKIIDALDVSAGDIIIEIGAGRGELTEILASRIEPQVKVIAVEKDSQLVNVLEKKFSDNHNVKIIEGDIRYDLDSIVEKYDLKTSKYKLLGNIPYYLTGNLLRKIIELSEMPSMCMFMVQNEVAERIVSKPPKMNILAASVQFWAMSKIIAKVGKEEFRPQPKVDSAIIRLTTKNSKPIIENRENYYKTVKNLFSAPRKTILNNLSSKNHKIFAGDRRRSKQKMADFLMKLGINPNVRPQNLTTEQILSISSALSEKIRPGQ